MIGIAARTGLLTLLLGLTGVLPATAQEAPEQAANEGIALHGHWTIEVYDEGQLVERREFDNALVNNGARMLTLLLAGADSMWTSGGTSHQIRILDNLCVTSTPDFGDVPSECRAGAGVAVDTIPNAEGWSTTSDLVDQNAITLTASFTVGFAGDITEVATAMDLVSSGGGYLTYKAIDPTIAVQEGQQVTVTVVLTFG